MYIYLPFFSAHPSEGDNEEEEERDPGLECKIKSEIPAVVQLRVDLLVNFVWPLYVPQAV